MTQLQAGDIRGLTGEGDPGAEFGGEVGSGSARADDASYEAISQDSTPSDPPTRLDVFHGYIGVFVVAFVVALAATPIMRRLAIANGIVDRPSDPRKIHRRPVAYLGGVAVFLGIMAGVFFSYVAPYLGSIGRGLLSFHETQYVHTDSPDSLAIPHPVPISILLGMTIIMLLGLIDDVVGIFPRLKIAGMFVAAAALAIEDVGVEVARGVLAPTLGVLLNNEQLVWHLEIPFEVPWMGTRLTFDLVYWTGTAIIAIFVLGACNAANLIDGLDGLLTGITAIATIGLLVIALSLAMVDDGRRDAQRIILGMSLLGACLGFLPHNFNPASIFLGDCGSLLLGFTTIVVVLTLGDTGRTNLVLAGLVIYSIPIMDTVLAIVRRKLAGRSISDADDQHLHHMLRRALGVKGAVFALYGIGFGFALLGIGMSLWDAEATYALALVFASYIVVIAIKQARAGEALPSRAPSPARRPGPNADAEPGALPVEPDAVPTDEPLVVGSSTPPR